MALRTTGDDPNSWVTLTEANMMVADFPNETLGYEPEEGQSPTFQFKPTDIKYLIEAHRQVALNWHFKGRTLTARQRLPFPRIGFLINSPAPGANWCETYFPNVPAEEHAYLLHLHFDTPGLSLYEELASDEIPEDVKEAAVILAALIKNGHSLFNDNKGDSTSVSIGSISTDNINAVLKSAGVRQRMGRWGRFIGENISKAPRNV